MGIRDRQVEILELQECYIMLVEMIGFLVGLYMNNTKINIETANIFQQVRMVILITLVIMRKRLVCTIVIT